MTGRQCLPGESVGTLPYVFVLAAPPGEAQLIPRYLDRGLADDEPVGDAHLGSPRLDKSGLDNFVYVSLNGMVVNKLVGTGQRLTEAAHPRLPGAVGSE